VPAARCRRCVYVFDEDEWVCERCGLEPPEGVTLVRLDQAPLALESDPDPAEYDADELGLDPEEDERCHD